jgi:hypothetical protein
MISMWQTYWDTGPRFIRSHLKDISYVPQRDLNLRLKDHKIEYKCEFHCQETNLNLIKSFQNEGLFPSCIALYFDGFGSISRHSVSDFFFIIFFFLGGGVSLQSIPIQFSNFFGLSIIEETQFVEMRIWCIEIDII